MKRPTFDLWPLLRGERFRDRFKQWAKHKLQHIRCYSLIVGPEVAIYYPDRCGGVLHTDDWWAFVKPDQLDDIAERFKSDEPGYHICKNTTGKPKKECVLDLRFNPLAVDDTFYIPCQICHTSHCCRYEKHIAIMLDRNKALS